MNTEDSQMMSFSQYVSYHCRSAAFLSGRVQQPHPLQSHFQEVQNSYLETASDETAQAGERAWGISVEVEIRGGYCWLPKYDALTITHKTVLGLDRHGFIRKRKMTEGRLC